MNSYAALVRLPGAASLLVAGFVARLGQGITVFAWLLLLANQWGSYQVAGLVTGAMTAATAVVSPVAGRLADRYGAARVLAILASGYCLAQCGLLTAAVLRAPLAVVVVLALMSGVLFPPTSAAIRAAWGSLTEGRYGDLRHPAMSAESAMFEIIFVLGPLIVSGLAASGIALPLPVSEGSASVGTALVLSIVTCAAGTAWLLRAQVLAPRPDTGHVSGRFWGPIKELPFVLLLVCMSGVGLTFGSTPVSLSALATQISPETATSLTGLWIAVWSLGSAVGGLGFGALRWHWPLRWQLFALLCGLGVGYVAWAHTSGALFLVVLCLSGLVIAPCMSVIAQLVSHLVSSQHQHEGFTWLSSISIASAAAGAAIAGALVETSDGVAVSLYLAAASALGAAAVSLFFSPTTPTALGPHLEREPCSHSSKR